MSWECTLSQIDLLIHNLATGILQETVIGPAKVKLYSLHFSVWVHRAKHLTLEGDLVHWP